jgi:hypothetical protein
VQVRFVPLSLDRQLPPLQFRQVLSSDLDEDDMDLPQNVSDYGNYNSNTENISEHNPDEIEDYISNPDEG